MKRDNTTLKSYFETGDYPTQGQFVDLIDSFLNIEEEDAITGITNNGDGTYTFQLLSGGSEVLDVQSLPNNIPIANIVGLQVILNGLQQNIDSKVYTNIESKGVGDVKTERNVWDDGVHTYSSHLNNINKPSGINYGTSIVWGRGTGGSAELMIGWTSADQNQIYFRSLRDTTDNWWSWKKIWHSGNDGSGSGLDADTLDGVDSTDLTPFQSISNFADGTFVLTSIDADVTNGKSFVMEITGKSYSSNNPPFKVVLQGYIYNNTFTSYSGISYGGNFPATIKILTHSSGKLAFWWERYSYWNNFNVKVTTRSSSSPVEKNTVTGISNSTEPSSSKKVSCNVIKTWNGNNDGSGSGLDADLLDGVQGDQFIRKTAMVGQLVNAYNSNLNGELTGLFYASSNSTNKPNDINSFIISHTIGSGYTQQIGGRNGKLFFRHQENNSWGSWNEFWHSNRNNSTTGTCTASNFILSSDERLKNNVHEIEPERINARWKSFYLKDQQEKRYGVIAQELEKEHPEFVRTNEDGYKSVAYVDLLVAKIAEKDREVNLLNKRLDKMESLIHNLTEKLS